MIKLSYDVKNYRKDLAELIKPGDTVIELGCHLGGTTRLIHKDANVIAIDNSPEAIGEMSGIENVLFISGDVRLHEIIRKVYEIEQKCDVLAIDLGGGYHPDTVFKVYYIWSSTLKPRDVLIRNQGLIDFVNSVHYDEEFESSEGWLESCGDQGIPPQIKEFSLWSDKI